MRRAVIEQQNRLMLEREREFRMAADVVTDAWVRFDEVQAIAVIGSVAKPLWKEVPRFSEFRRAGIEVWHECTVLWRKCRKPLISTTYCLSYLSAMATSIIINGLTVRVPEIRGQIVALESQIAKQRTDLTHVMATLRMFDPTVTDKAIRPKHPTRPRSTFLVVGEISRRCLDALREAVKPISADEIAVKAMPDKGLDVSDQAIRADMTKRLLWALDRFALSGQVERVGRGTEARWTLPEDRR